MRPTVTDRVAWYVGLSVCHTSEPCKNSCTHGDAIWVKDSGASTEPCVRWGSRSPPWEGVILRAHPIVKYRDTAVTCAKTAQPIEMLFRLWARMGRRNRVGWGFTDGEGRCHDN